jgi:hypothetical protein
MKMTALWDTAPSSFIEVNRRFRGAYCLHNRGDDHLLQCGPTFCDSRANLYNAANTVGRKQNTITMAMAKIKKSKTFN